MGNVNRTNGPAPERPRRGVSTVEMAIVLPLFLLLVMGLIEWSWVFLNQHAVSNAAREGARTAALDGSTAAEVNAAVSGALAGAGITDNFTVGFGSNMATVNDTNLGAFEPGDPITLRVVLDYSEVSLGMPIPTPNTLAHEVTMTKEGP